MLVPLVALLAFGAFAALIVMLLKGADKGASVAEAEAPVQGRAVNRMQAGMRRRRAGGRGAAADEEDEGEMEEDAGVAQEDAKVSRKDAYEARRAAKDAERAALEAAQEEEMRRAAEERRKREEEEAAKWMTSFTVEAAGEEVLSKEDDEALLTRLVDYIQRRKTVGMDEIGAEFNLRTADAIARVQALEADGRITGVMDDRGKYIYVGKEEMAAVADFIRSKGRVPIAELASKSNMFIDLAPKEIEGGLLLDVES